MENGTLGAWNKVSREVLFEVLPYENPINKCAILCELVKRKVHSKRAKDLIANLANNQDIFWNNYTVSDFAYAALDILGYNKYSGSRMEVQDLIKSGLRF